MDHPAHAAAVPMAYGAGIGRVGEFYEQGNFYRGGAIQQSMITWMFTEQNTQRPTSPPDLSHEDRVRLARYSDLAMNVVEPDWDEALWHLPMSEMFDTACTEVGRDLSTIEKTVGILWVAKGRNESIPGWCTRWFNNPLSGEPEEVVDVFRQFANMGVSHIQVVAFPNSLAGIEEFRPVHEALDQTP